MKQSICIKNAPAVIGPYSQAIRIENFIFFSGQLGFNSMTGEFLSDSIFWQTDQIFKNLATMLSEIKLTLKNVIKMTIFLSDISNYSVVNELCIQYFTPPYPARSVVEVKALPKNALIEIEIIAHVFSV